MNREIKNHPETFLPIEISTLIKSGKKVATDSRLVQPGDIFIATFSEGSDFYRGKEDKEYKKPYSFDAHLYISNAVEKGASVIVLSKPEFIPKTVSSETEIVQVKNTTSFLGQTLRKEIEKNKKLVFGVTGSTGKSTLSEMIAIVLDKSRTYKHLSTRPTPISIPLRALNSQQFYASKNIVIEMPMDGLGQIAQLCEITPPDVGVILNINPSHIVQLGTMENIVKAKMEIAANLKREGTLVVNVDDQYLKPQIPSIKKSETKVLTFGKDETADIRIMGSGWGTRGFDVKLLYKGKTETINSPYIGSEISCSLAASVAAGIAVGIDFSLACNRLSQMEALPGRMSLLRGNRGELILDDTRLATPQSTEKLLETVAQTRGRRKILIQGPILRTYQHGQPEKKVSATMELFDKVLLFQSSEWLGDKSTEFPLAKTQDGLLNWYNNNVKATDLVVINASESIKMWKVLHKLVSPEDKDKIYNPNKHD